jgi:hypothetical protein
MKQQSADARKGGDSMQHWHLGRKALSLVAVMVVSLAIFGCSDDDDDNLVGGAPDLEDLSGARITLNHQPASRTGLEVLLGQTVTIDARAFHQGSTLGQIEITFANTFTEVNNNGFFDAAGETIPFTVTDGDLTGTGVLILLAPAVTPNFDLVPDANSPFPQNTGLFPGVPGVPGERVQCRSASFCRVELTVRQAEIGGSAVPGTMIVVLGPRDDPNFQQPNVAFNSDPVSVDIQIAADGTIVVDGQDSTLAVAVD